MRGINKDVVIFAAGLVILALLRWKKDCVTSTVSFPSMAYDSGTTVQPAPGMLAL